MKCCTKCKVEKDIQSFQKFKKNTKCGSKEYYKSQCKECMKSQRKEYFSNYKKEKSEKIKERISDYYKNNPEKKKISQKRWRDKNPSYYREYQQNRLNNDLIFNISRSIRNRISKAISRQKFRKNSKTSDILGCNFLDFKIYIESKFEYWMSWENRGLYNGEFNHGWDLDHIIPISTAKSEQDIIRLNHYTNFQPLCSKVNRDIKINKI